MRKIGSLIFVLAIFVQASAQKNWEAKFNGYVLTRDSVTIKGYLKFAVGDPDRGIKIDLYKKPNEKPQVFYSLELLAYAIKKDTFEILPNVHPLPPQPFSLIEKKRPPMVEAKILCRGKLILYEIRETAYTLNPAAPPSKPLDPVVATSGYMAYKYTLYGAMDDQGIMTYVTRDDFIKQMKVLLHDAPNLLARVENKELKFNAMEQIVQEYNQQFR